MHSPSCRHWPEKFKAADVVNLIIVKNNPDGDALFEFFYPEASPGHVATPKSIGRLLKQHADNAVKKDKDTTLILRRHRERADELLYSVERKEKKGEEGVKKRSRRRNCFEG